MPVLTKPSSCSSCPLYEKGAGFSRPSGLGSLGVLLAGEALGEHEVREGRPFVEYAQAGSMLERIIRSSGFSREQFRLWNIVACRPPKDWLDGAPWMIGAVEHCRHHFRAVVDEMRPKAILAMGAVPLWALTGAAGKNQNVHYLRGYAFETEWGIVVPTFHPSHLKRGETRFISVVWRDLKYAVQLARMGFKRKEVRYQTTPSLDDARSYYLRVKDAPQQLLTYDIETPNSAEMPEDERDDDPSYDLRSIQFSLAPQEGIFFPATLDYLEIARKIMALPNPKAGSNNWNFDDPRLRHNGFQIGGNQNDDIMWMWHHMQPDLPAHLQFMASFYGMDFPWKHLAGTDQSTTYGCADVDAPQRIMVDLPGDLRRRGVWEGYERHVRGLHPILVDTSDRGIPIDDTARLALGVTLDGLKAETREEIGRLAPPECLKIEPKTGYKALPPRVKEMVNRGMTASAIAQQAFTDPPKGDDAVGETFRFVLKDFEVTALLQPQGDLFAPQPDVDPEKIGTFQTQIVRKWVRQYDFNPGSWQQIIRYMKAKKHPIPKDPHKTDSEGAAKDTTNKKELERLTNKTGDTFYMKVIQFREYQKMKGTYVDGYAPSPKDGCVHTTFTFRPATGQLSSVNPNAQNAPKHDDPKKELKLAHEFRKVIRAKPGHCLVEGDFKSFHALTLGYLAKDPDYMKAARADIHSYLGAFVIKHPLRDQLIRMPMDQFKAVLKEIKVAHKFDRDFKWKRAQLGYGFGMGYRKLWQMYRESFSNQTECKVILETLDKIFPRTAKFRETICEQAHRQGFLMSPYNYIRWFHDVFHWDPRKAGLAHGEDHEAAIAFLPANIAFGHIKDVILRLQEGGYLEEFNFINTVHDSLVFHPELGKRDRCIEIVHDEMIKPNLRLIDPLVAPNGLQVEAEFSVGDNWAEMQEVKIASTMQAEV